MIPFLTLVPALYMNATVKPAVFLGNLSTGGGLAFGELSSANLYSEPGFEPSFSASFLFAGDFPTLDPTGSVARFDFHGAVQPDDGDSAFEMMAQGIQNITPEGSAICLGAEGSLPYGNSYTVWYPTFRGGSDKYAVLQDRIFVGSMAIASGEHPGETRMGFKMSMVVPTNTSIHIGEEFP